MLTVRRPSERVLNDTQCPMRPLYSRPMPRYESTPSGEQPLPPIDPSRPVDPPSYADPPGYADPPVDPPVEPPVDPPVEPPVDPPVDPPFDPPGRDLPISQGARLVPDRATFETLARSDDVPGQLGAEEMKILIIGVDTPAPELYFLNTKAFQYHYDFATEALGIQQGLGEFNSRTYFRDDRSNLAGTIIANDRFEPTPGEAGLYALEFWPTDPVRAPHVALAFDLVTAAMPFAAGKIATTPPATPRRRCSRRTAMRCARPACGRSSPPSCSPMSATSR